MPFIQHKKTGKITPDEYYLTLLRIHHKLVCSDLFKLSYCFKSNSCSFLFKTLLNIKMSTFSDRLATFILSQIENITNIQASTLVDATPPLSSPLLGQPRPQLHRLMHMEPMDSSVNSSVTIRETSHASRSARW
jgi:hypothetical protein